jgi:hypothetical protein
MNVKLVIRPIVVTVITKHIGIGLSSSAASGANIVATLAMKLHIPMAVVRFSKGKVFGSLKLT